jgi:hypothetical protein
MGAFDAFHLLVLVFLTVVFRAFRGRFTPKSHKKSAI